MGQQAAEDTAGVKAKSGNVFQENLEAVVVAVILALIIRHYAMEAFVIPTGSMAPTLLGEHFVVECGNCKRPWAVGKSETTFTARCEICQEKRQVKRGDNGFGNGDVNYDNSVPFMNSAIHGGNKILVNKLIYKFTDPERFDVMVFKYPVEPGRNFIKRVVGLPNERLKIEHGDVFVNGKRVVKRVDIQNKMWHGIYDQNYPSQEGKAEPWHEDSTGRWVIRRRGEGGEKMIQDAGKRAGIEMEVIKDASLVAKNAFIAASAPRRTRISYATVVRDTYGYNPTSKEGNSQYSPDGEHIVVDLAAKLEIIPLGNKGPIVLGITENNSPLTISLPVEGTTYTLEREAAPHFKAVKVTKEGPALKVGEINTIEYAWWDRRARLMVNGTEVLVWDDPNGKTQPTSSGVYLESSESGAIFQRVKLYRDIYYYPHSNDSAPGNVEWDSETKEIIIPEDSYICLGDNAPNSKDSRSWGYVNRGHLVGRAFTVFWPLSEIRLIR